MKVDNGSSVLASHGSSWWWWPLPGGPGDTATFGQRPPHDWAPWLGTFYWIVHIVGVITCVRLCVGLFRNVRFLYAHWVRRPHDLLRRYGAGSWVVVTGASDGIGLGFAVEFAKLGFNIVLIARNTEKLERAAAHVKEEANRARDARRRAVGDSHDNLRKDVEVKQTSAQADARSERVGDDAVQVKVLVMDFKQCHDLSFWSDRFDKPLRELDVSVLVNNVGMNETDHFDQIDPQCLLDMVSVNCTTQLLATRCLIERLKARTDGRKAALPSIAAAPSTVRSAVISLSSIAGQRPLLYLSPYSATKAFNDFFSRALALEFGGGDSPGFGCSSPAGGGIDVLSCRPAYVVSNMSHITEKSGFVIDRYECARSCMDKLGYVTETYGDPRHAVYARSYFWLPERWLRSIRERRLRAKQKKGPTSSPSLGDTKGP